MPIEIIVVFGAETVLLIALVAMKVWLEWTDVLSGRYFVGPAVPARDLSIARPCQQADGELGRPTSAPTELPSRLIAPA